MSTVVYSRKANATSIARILSVLLLALFATPLQAQTASWEGAWSTKGTLMEQGDGESVENKLNTVLTITKTGDSLYVTLTSKAQNCFSSAMSFPISKVTMTPTTLVVGMAKVYVLTANDDSWHEPPPYDKDRVWRFLEYSENLPEYFQETYDQKRMTYAVALDISITPKGGIKGTYSVSRSGYTLTENCMYEFTGSRKK
jgi:hypothetical protein